MPSLGNGQEIVLLDDDEIDRMVAARNYDRSSLDNPWRDFSLVRDFLAWMEGCRERGHVPALVLLDINMPGMSGFDVLAWVREQPEFADLPVMCMFTNSNATRDQERAQQEGADGYLVKPSTHQAYVEMFDGLLERFDRA